MPQDLPLFEDMLILLVASIPIAFIANRLRLPVIVAFMVTGVLIGPYGLALINDVHAVEALAEIGVVLLLFAIGLEFSLRRILDMKRVVFGGGGIQVTLTALLTTFVAYEAGRRFGQAIFFGFLLALSSTAIVLKSYMDRAELDSPHGKAGIGILLFQDLCVVPMMLLVPVLSGKEGSSTVNILLTLGSAFAALAIIIVTARKIIPYLLHHIVRLRSPEVFIIFIVLVSLGTSWVTAQFGLSLALGAFIAGLVLSESEYSHQIVADVLPFRDVFNSIFFISIGMLLSIGFLVTNVWMVMAWVARADCWQGHHRCTGGAVVGEFAAGVHDDGRRSGAGRGILVHPRQSRARPGIAHGRRLSNFSCRRDHLDGRNALSDQGGAANRVRHSIEAIAELAPRTEMMGFVPQGQELIGHVIVVGYGLNGRNLSTVLRRVSISYVVLELNAELVRSASRAGEPVRYGDSTRREVLHAVNLQRARVLVLAISDPIAARRTVAVAREMDPDIHIIVRTRYMSELADLYKLGANQVIPEEFETSIEIFSRVLSEFGVARRTIHREIEEIRREGYQMLRMPSAPVVEIGDIAGALGAASTESLVIGRGDRAAGKTLEELDLRRTSGATVIAVVRGSYTEINPGGQFRLDPEDVVVMLGSPEQIEIATDEITGSVPTA